MVPFSCKRLCSLLPLLEWKLWTYAAAEGEERSNAAPVLSAHQPAAALRAPDPAAPRGNPAHPSPSAAPQSVAAGGMRQSPSKAPAMGQAAEGRRPAGRKRGRPAAGRSAPGPTALADPGAAPAADTSQPAAACAAAAEAPAGSRSLTASMQQAAGALGLEVQQPGSAPAADAAVQVPAGPALQQIEGQQAPVALVDACRGAETRTHAPDDPGAYLLVCAVLFIWRICGASAANVHWAHPLLAC